MPELIAVNVVHRIIPGRHRETAIDKRPCAGEVEVTALGLVGDTQCDQRFHGGPDKALYAYAAEDNAWWADHLDREIRPGTFGENLTTIGLDISRALIGETWRIGEVVVEVRSPRTPCSNLAHRMDLPRFQQRFQRTGRVGAYLKVWRVGTVAAGMAVEVVSRPDHDVTIADWATPTAESAAKLLQANDVDLADDLRAQAERVRARALRTSALRTSG